MNFEPRQLHESEPTPGNDLSHWSSYPGQDCKGDTNSIIGEETAFNPGLKVTSANEYAEITNNLNLPNPKMKDVAVPENLRLGLRISNSAHSQIGTYLTSWCSGV